MNSLRKWAALSTYSSRDDLLLEDALLVVNVVQEKVQRADALGQAALQEVPFVRRDDARDQVERENLLRALAVAVDGERDALREERLIGEHPFAPELVVAHLAEAVPGASRNAGAPSPGALNISSKKSSGW